MNRCFVVILLWIGPLMSDAQNDAGRKDTSRFVLAMESYKQQYPDSFYAKLYDWELMNYYRQQHDTLAFLEEAKKFLVVPAQQYTHRDYLKTPACRLLCYFYEARLDTANLILYEEKRLFLYNRLKCRTGEDHYRLTLFDSLIKLYSVKGQTDRAEALKKERAYFVRKKKLRVPGYLG